MRLRALTLAAFAASTSLAGAHHTGGPVAFTVAGPGSIKGPAGLANTGGNSIAIADTIGQRIRQLDFRQRVRTLAGTGEPGDAGDGGLALSAQLQDPTALEATLAGLAFADTSNNRVRVIRPDGTVGALAGSGEQGFSGDGGPATAAQLNAPAGLEQTGSGTILISDTGNHRIRAIDGGVIRTIAGTGAAAFAGDGGPATAASLNHPTGLAIARDGALLVADAGNRRIRRIGPDGVITTVAGNGGGGSGGDGGPATAAGLNDPVDVAAGSDGSIYIAETGGNRVRRVLPDGTITRLAGTGAPRYGGDGRDATAAYLNSPRAVELGPGGDDLLVADSDNDRIRYVTVPTAACDAMVRCYLLALAPVTRSVTAPLRKGVVRQPRIRYVVNLADRVRVTVRRKRGRRLATLRAPAGTGTRRLALPRRLRVGRRRLTKGFYTLSFRATDSRGRAVTRTMELIVR